MKFLCTKEQCRAIAEYFGNPEREGQERDKDFDTNFVSMTLGHENGALWRRFLDRTGEDVMFVALEGVDGATACNCATCQLCMARLVAIEDGDLNASLDAENRLKKIRWIETMMDALAKLPPGAFDEIAAIASSLELSPHVEAFNARFAKFRQTYFELRRYRIANNTLQATPQDEQFQEEEPRLRVVITGQAEILYGNGREMRTIAACNGGLDATIYPSAHNARLVANGQ